MTITEAASALGVSEKTVRRRIKAGLLQARQMPTHGGFEYRVDVDVIKAPVVEKEQEDVQLMTLAAMDVLRSQLAEKERLLAELQEERLRMAEQVGYAKAQIQQLQMQVRLLGEHQSAESEQRMVTVQNQKGGFWSGLRRIIGAKRA